MEREILRIEFRTYVYYRYGDASPKHRQLEGAFCRIDDKGCAGGIDNTRPCDGQSRQ